MARSRFQRQRPKALDDTVYVGTHRISDCEPVYIVAELGINHNGDVDLACEMVRSAAKCGANAVKLQKRTVDVVYTSDELAMPRESPFGKTNGDLKRRLELNDAAYRKIAQEARQNELDWFASPWDLESLEYLKHFSGCMPAAVKIASACVSNLPLVHACSTSGMPVMMSTGMSTEQEIDTAVKLVTSNTSSLVLLHTISAYPVDDCELRLDLIEYLWSRYYPLPVGYSGHERGIATTLVAVALGACVVERHFTLDRTMFGSDQAASLEPTGFARMCRDIRALETARLNPDVFQPRRVYDCEARTAAKLKQVKGLLA